MHRCIDTSMYRYINRWSIQSGEDQYRVAKTNRRSYLIGHFPQKSPVISGSFAKNDLQLQQYRVAKPMSRHVLMILKSFTCWGPHVDFTWDSHVCCSVLFSVSQCVAVCCAGCCSVLQSDSNVVHVLNSHVIHVCVAVCCTVCCSVLHSVLQCVAQCVAVCCAVIHTCSTCWLHMWFTCVLQCVAQCVAVCWSVLHSVLQCAAVCCTVCCSVLRSDSYVVYTLNSHVIRVVVCCSVLQRVAACCSVLRSDSHVVYTLNSHVIHMWNGECTFHVPTSNAHHTGEWYESYCVAQSVAQSVTGLFYKRALFNSVNDTNHRAMTIGDSYVRMWNVKCAPVCWSPSSLSAHFTYLSDAHSRYSQRVSR